MNIANRIQRLQDGAIEKVFAKSMKVRSWKASTQQPKRTKNRAAEEAAEGVNFRTAAARICNNNIIAPIGTNSIRTVEGLFAPLLPPLHCPPPPRTVRHQPVHLLGDIYNIIKKESKNTGAAINADSMDIFSNLVALGIASINDDICQLFDLVFHSLIPPKVWC